MAEEWNPVAFTYGITNYTNDGSDNGLYIYSADKVDDYNIRVLGFVWTDVDYVPAYNLYNLNLTTGLLTLIDDELVADLTTIVTDFDAAWSLLSVRFGEVKYVKGATYVILTASIRQRAVQAAGTDSNISCVYKIVGGSRETVFDSLTDGRYLIYQLVEDDDTPYEDPFYATQAIMHVDKTSTGVSGYFNFSLKYPELASQYSWLITNKYLESAPSTWSSQYSYYTLPIAITVTGDYFRVTSSNIKEIWFDINSTEVTYDDFDLEECVLEVSSDPFYNGEETLYYSASVTSYHCGYTGWQSLADERQYTKARVDTITSSMEYVGVEKLTQNMSDEYVYSEITKSLMNHNKHTWASYLLTSSVENLLGESSSSNFNNAQLFYDERRFYNPVLTKYISEEDFNTEIVDSETDCAISADIVKQWTDASWVDFSISPDDYDMFLKGCMVIRPNGYNITFYETDYDDDVWGYLTFNGIEGLLITDIVKIPYAYFGISFYHYGFEYPTGIYSLMAVEDGDAWTKNMTLWTTTIIQSPKAKPTSFTVTSDDEMFIGARIEVNSFLTISGVLVDSEDLFGIPRYRPPIGFYTTLPGAVTTSGDKTSSIFSYSRIMGMSGYAYTRKYSFDSAVFTGNLFPYQLALMSRFTWDDLTFDLPENNFAKTIEYAGENIYYMGNNGIYKSVGDFILGVSGTAPKISTWSLFNTSLGAINSSILTSLNFMYVDAATLVTSPIGVVDFIEADGGLPEGVVILDLEEEIYADR